MALKEWFIVKELAGLPGMPGTVQGVLKYLKKNLVSTRPYGLSRGLEYALNGLPPETQAHIAAQAAADVLACLPAEVVSMDLIPRTLSPEELALTSREKNQHPTAWHQTTQQRAVNQARNTVLRFVKRLEDEAGCTTRRAMLTFLTQATAGRLDGDAKTAVLLLSRDSRGRKASNAHPNAIGVPSLRTLQGWLKRDTDKQPGQNLAPKMPQPDMTVEAWMVLAVELKRRPQKPVTTEVRLHMLREWPEFSLKWVQQQQKRGTLALPLEHQQKLAAQLPFPSADQLYRFFRDKFSALDLLVGQHQGSALRAHKLYHERTNAGLMPWDEIHADGWNTHFTAPHPVTGDYMTFEVWHFHDIVTGYTPPFSIGRSESQDVILKGLEHCIRFGGVPLIWQTDSTGSVKNKSVELDPILSISARAGLTVVHPTEVGNSQANGMPENYNKYLDKKSRELATYQHPSMDTLAYKRVRKYTAQMVTAANKGDAATYQRAQADVLRTGRGLLFTTHPQMLAWLEEIRVLGNNTPYSKNLKITDPFTGKKRHQTPQEAIDMHRANGWKGVMLDDSELVELFYPHLSKKVIRETVSVGGQRYYHECLGDYNGQELVVSVDPMDGHHVWVKDQSGRLLCVARYQEKVGYRCRSAHEAAEEKRMNAQIRRNDNKNDAIRDQRDPARAPLNLQAPDVSEALVLPFGLVSGAQERREALIAAHQAQREADELTAQTAAAAPSRAERLYGAQIEAEDRAREAGLVNKAPVVVSLGERLLAQQEREAAAAAAAPASVVETREQRYLRQIEEEDARAEEEAELAALSLPEKDSATSEEGRKAV